MFENTLQSDILEDNEERTLKRKHLIILIILVGLIAVLMISIIVISVTELSEQPDDKEESNTTDKHIEEEGEIIEHPKEESEES